MMFGMSVHAQTVYCLMSQMAGRDPSRNWAPTTGITRSGVVTLNSGDKIQAESKLFVKVGDNPQVEAVMLSEVGYYEWEYMGAQQTFEWTVERVNNTEYHVTLKPKSTSSAAPGEPAPEKEEDKHEHNWEWIQIQAATDAQDGVEAMCCTECGQQGESRTIVSSAYGVFCGETKDKITGAAENATVEMETEIWSALPKSVMDAIKERRDLTVNLTLTYQNKEYPLSIPAGYDMSVLEEADWYGVLYLNQFFGVANQ